LAKCDIQAMLQTDDSLPVPL